MLRVPQAFLPKFYGAADSTGDGVMDILELEDITHGLDSATLSILDIKLGTRTFVESVSTVHNDRYVQKLKKFGVVRQQCRSSIHSFAFLIALRMNSGSW